jgi:hypothetical protein
MSKLRIPATVKLQALEMKFYSGLKWQPKVSDLYTIARADDEVFEIVDESDSNFYIKTRTNLQDTPTPFPKGGFTTDDFGKHRIYIHPSLHAQLTEDES